MSQDDAARASPGAERAHESDLDDDGRSSESWADSSSDDGRASPAPQPPVRIKVKRSRTPSRPGDESASERPRALPRVPPADTLVSVRPLKQLRSKTLRAALDALIVGLKKRDSYLFFHEPVNADEVPGYRDVITHPMDLGTMEKRIHEGYYTHMDMFQHDFMLVTQNAQQFNPPSSIYHTAARRLEVWGLRAIAREAMSVVDDDQLDAQQPEEPPARRGRRKRSSLSIEAEPHAEHLSRRMMRIGSARSTTWSLQGVQTNDPDELLFRRTLAYAGVGQHQLTGKSACSARVHAKPKRRLAPPLSTTATEDAVEDTEASPFAFHDDGSLDAAQLADVREYLAQQTLLAPQLESLQHLPMMLAAQPPPNAAAASSPSSAAGAPPAPGEPSLVFPPAQPGRPDALYAATRTYPEAASKNTSHSFEHTHVPDAQRALPYMLASVPGPSGLGTHGTRPMRPIWPALPPPALQEARLRLNRRERELEQERDESNWTFFRPHMHRILAHEDVGLYANVPAWAACVSDDQPLQPYATASGEPLLHTLRECLRSLPYRAVGLPRTAQFVPRASLQHLPPALQVAMQGAQESERLIDTVYGSVDGLAYARSLAEFVGGASGDTHLHQHVRRAVLEPMTGGLLGLLSDVGQSMQAHVDASDKLMQLLDDEDGSLAAALWQKPGAAPALDQVLQALVE